MDLEIFDFDRPLGVILTVGLPGAGKSTRLVHWAEVFRLQVVCLDDLRLGLGAEFDPKNEPAVHRLALELARGHLERGHTVAVDDSFTDPSLVAPYRFLVDRFDARLWATARFTSPTECLARRSDKPWAAEAIERKRRELLADWPAIKLLFHEVDEFGSLDDLREPARPAEST